jgi:hypothetical protein
MVVDGHQQSTKIFQKTKTKSSPKCPVETALDKRVCQGLRLASGPLLVVGAHVGKYAIPMAKVMDSEGLVIEGLAKAMPLQKPKIPLHYLTSPLRGQAL